MQTSNSQLLPSSPRIAIRMRAVAVAAESAVWLQQVQARTQRCPQPAALRPLSLALRGICRVHPSATRCGCMPSIMSMCCCVRSCVADRPALLAAWGTGVTGGRWAGPRRSVSLPNQRDRATL